jgi:hypothetical protein
MDKLKNLKKDRKRLDGLMDKFNYSIKLINKNKEAVEI